MVKYCTRSLRQCVFEQKIVEYENNDKFKQFLEAEHSIVDKLRTISENNTWIQWRKDQ